MSVLPPTVKKDQPVNPVLESIPDFNLGVCDGDDCGVWTMRQRVRLEENGPVRQLCWYCLSRLRREKKEEAAA